MHKISCYRLTSIKFSRMHTKPVIADLIRNLQAIACKPSPSLSPRLSPLYANSDELGVAIVIMKIAGQARNDRTGAYSNDRAVACSLILE